MIYTFYSYKGGVGRSMTLANIAELLFASGLEVLLIDWDLEAPGLERYFPSATAQVLDHDGLMNLLVEYKARMAAPTTDQKSTTPWLPNLKDYVVDLYPHHQGPGRLRLMSAGLRSGDNFTRYGELVRSFDWQDFYQNWEGELFFEWFRRQLYDLADVAVIDSRTGVSEMGGVCTYQLADAIVMFCAPSDQSLDGTFNMAQNFKSPDVALLREDRPLGVLVVPARVEDRAETDLYGEFKEDFLRRFSHEKFAVDSALAASAEVMWRLKIPHVPFYAFRETVVVREQGTKRHADMYDAVLRLRARIALMAPEDSPVRIATRKARAQAREDLSSSVVTPAVWNIPYRRNPMFTGRAEILIRLEEFFAEGSGPASVEVGLIGLAGVGKTALAAEYLYRHAEDYSLIWWIRAGSGTTFHEDCQQLAAAAGLPEEADQEATVAAIRRWLESRQAWLLVLDDVEHREQILELLPRSGAGHVLFTTRRTSGWTDVAQHIVTVDVLPPDDATALLLRRTGQTDEQAAAWLAEELGGHPLALELAGAFIAETGMVSIAEYLELFRSRGIELLRQGQPVDHQSAVDTVWLPSLEALRRENHAAVELLHLVAYLAPDDIPWQILITHAEDLSDELRRAAQDQVTLASTLAALQRLALAKVTDDALSVHRLLQAVIREGESEEKRDFSAGLAARVMRASFPADSWNVSTWPTCQRLLPHVLAVTDHCERLGVELEATSWLLDRAADYLRKRARFPDAKALLERSLMISERALGPQHPAAATVHSNLGGVLGELGDLAGARAHFEAALEIDLVAFGPDHPTQARDHSNLGTVLRDLGDLTGARMAFLRALEIDERASGPDHLTSAVRRNNLGDVLGELGDLDGARTQFERALAITEAALGPDHPDAAVIRGNLGNVLREVGDLTGAKVHLERVLAIDEATYGPDHPTVGTDRNNLGMLLQDLGDVNAARTQFERALDITEAALGPDHPSLALARNNLGSILKELGDHKAARTQFERALAITQAILGPDHPDAAVIRNNLGDVLLDLGDLDGARTQFEQALAITEAAFGLDHPTVATRRNNLGKVLWLLGDLGGARTQFERALEITEAALGPDHPQSQIIAENLEAVGRVPRVN